MLIDRIYLRNYRVYRDELDLALPAGLVGVYGPNGAGKSTLLEAILWALWGKARTGKEQVRTAGANGDCVAEVTFEHEGHIYVVRRTISGANNSVKASAQCDGQLVAEGVRECARYVHSVLGMDDAAFRASVFAEQKQVSAFSEQGPAERRKLVLSLLGVTPLDGARDRARSDARQRTTEHDHLRSMLPDLAALQVAQADADAAAGALESQAQDLESAAATAMLALGQRREAVERLARAGLEYERLVERGRTARAALDRASAAVDELGREQAELEGAEARLAELGPRAARLAQAQAGVQALDGLVEALSDLEGLAPVDEPAEPDEPALEEASAALVVARESLSAAQAKLELACMQLAQATDALGRSAGLDPAEDCPLCGQALGRALAAVQSHRADDVAAAEVRAAEAQKEVEEASARAQSLAKELKALTARVSKAREAHTAWQKAQLLHQAARERATRSYQVARQTQAEPKPDRRERALPGGQEGALPSLGQARSWASQAAQGLAEASNADHECRLLQARLERRPKVETELGQARLDLREGTNVVEALRAQVKALAFEPEALARANAELSDAQAVADKAVAQAQQARVVAASARARAEGEAQRLQEGQHQHAQLDDLESQARHLSRTAELLNGFRNEVVASVGPRLATQAASLFGELTDNEYDSLEVDAETYGLQILDGGVAYDLARFSGSETDLANLAMRVAISEHVRLLSGGTVGLLVLDEIFGPLDEDRRSRMLLALERLRARFRQILVVTHSVEVKDQLPSAIEVLKQPGRTATARVMAA